MKQNIIKKYDGDSHQILKNIEKYEVFEIVENKEKENNNVGFSDSMIRLGTEVAKDILVLNQIPKNLFVSSVDPSLLSNLKGGFGTAVFKDGKISEHVPFLKANMDLSKIVTPFVVMQIASIALGQHFMFEINNKLGEISKDIKDIKERLDDIEISKLKAFERYLRERQGDMTERHISYIEIEMQIEINQILETFFETIKRKLKEAKKITASGFSLTAKGSVEKLKKELQKLELDKYIGIYQYAEFLLIFSMFLVWQYYTSESNFEEADKVYKKIIQRENELEDEFKKIYYGYQQMREKIFEEMKKIQKSSDSKAKITEFGIDFLLPNPFGVGDYIKNEMSDYIKNNEELFFPLRSYVENIPQRKSFMQTKQEVLYVQQDDRVFALIQKGQS